MKPLKRVVIKEELVELTGGFIPALILNQFIYWIERMYDADKYILEEKERALKEDIEINISESKGWIYKTATQLSEELMIGVSDSTIRRHMKKLIQSGYIHERKNPKYKSDQTLQYRVNLYKVQLDLAKLGYALEGYKLLPNIKIVEDEVVEDVKVDENKKASTFAEVEAEENLENLIDNDIIPQNDKMYTSNLKNNEKENEILKNDIESKNKELMEQEKQFVPSFKMRWN